MKKLVVREKVTKLYWQAQTLEEMRKLRQAHFQLKQAGYTTDLRDSNMSCSLRIILYGYPIERTLLQKEAEKMVDLF